MNSNENLILSEPSLTLSAEAYAMIRRDRIQSIINKLNYIHDLSEAERSLLLQELQALEEEQPISGIINQDQTMYTPEKESLEVLQARKKELMDKIINGSHLDSLSIQALQNQLADVRKKITEQEKEVSNG